MAQQGSLLNSFQIYGLAIGANLTYSSASLVFSIYARRFSSSWINQIKVMVAFVAFLLAALGSGQFISLSWGALALLLSSGFMGLCLGDLFLYRAFAALGAGRSLVLYSFQPLLLGVYGYFFLGQIFTIYQILAVASMMICIFIFMLERNQQVGHWDIKNFLWALLGISLDAVGIILTRSAYEQVPGLETFQVNTLRCLGAILGFFLLHPRNFVGSFGTFLQLKTKEKGWVAGSAFVGCFLSLTMYLAALKYAHVGTLTSIAITGPVWVSLLECLYHRRWPDKLLLLAFSFFLIGFYLMIQN